MFDTTMDPLIRLALAEDIGTGDRTTLGTVPANASVEAVVVAKQPLVLAGGAWFVRTLELAGGGVRTEQLLPDGTQVESGRAVLRMSGLAHTILAGERTALNILQRLTGTATLTRRFVDAIAGTRARIVDTRKTTPGLRTAQKHAVRMGGGANHRFGLDSGVLVKENHIAAAGSITLALQRLRADVPHLLKIEVEVTNLDELGEAIDAGADAVLLDNMSDELLMACVARVRASGRPVITEASGNLSLERVRHVAELGVNLLSVGALTHSAPAADLSLRVTT